MKVIMTAQEAELAKTNQPNKARLTTFILQSMKENSFHSFYLVAHQWDEPEYEPEDIPPKDWADFQLIDSKPFKRPMPPDMEVDVTKKLKKMSKSIQKRRIDPSVCAIALASLINTKDDAYGLFIISFHDGKKLTEGFIATSGPIATSLIKGCCSGDVDVELSTNSYQSN